MISKPNSLSAKPHLESIFIFFFRKGESHCFHFHEIHTNFAPLRRSAKKNTEKIIFQNSAKHIQQAALAEREIPDGLASPAPKLPPVPKVAARLQKQAEREAKQKAQTQAKLLSRGRTGPTW